jgi:hypothetical protein
MRFELSLSKQPCHPERSEERKRCGLSFLYPNNLVIPSAARRGSDAVRAFSLQTTLSSRAQRGICIFQPHPHLQRFSASST